MKATGVIRKLDSLGRIVIPIELRRLMSIKPNDPLEISIDANFIVIEKYIDRCYICCNTENLKVFSEKHICQDCIDEL